MRDTEYTEIFKLRDMLDAIDLEYEFHDRSIPIPQYKDRHEHYQIILLDEYGNKIVSVIQGSCTYGGTQNKLEIMGLLTPEEEEHDSVVGYLTADEVYERIIKYYGSREEL